VPADDLTGVIDCISSLKGIWFVGAPKAEILDRTVGKQRRAMILIATLAVADHCPTIINPKCFAS